MRLHLTRLPLAFAAVAAWLGASFAFAQQPAPRAVATLAEAEGSVLVSNPTGLATGVKGNALRSGMRVITPANARATIRYEDGCVVELKPHQRIVIDLSVPCEGRLLQVQAALPQPLQPVPNAGLSTAALNGSLTNYAGYAVGGAFTVIAIDRWRREGSETGSGNGPPVSPN